MLLEKKKKTIRPTLHWFILAKVKEISLFHWLIPDQVTIFSFIICQRNVSLLATTIVFLQIVEITYSHWFWYLMFWHQVKLFSQDLLFLQLHQWLTQLFWSLGNLRFLRLLWFCFWVLQRSVLKICFLKYLLNSIFLLRYFGVQKVWVLRSGCFWLKLLGGFDCFFMPTGTYRR